MPLRGNGGNGRFKMPSALLWAVSAEELFEILGFRKARGLFRTPFSRMGSGRQEAAAVPVLTENIAALFSTSFIMKEIHLTK